ncbi:MAG: ATP-binding protein [Gammaproteobacteria bacterium]|nr:ATP-binding protein [Gammaproteobacteria bacterium]
MSRILFWRWPLLAWVLVIIGTRAPTVGWGFALAFTVVATQIALHAFEPDRLERWLGRGYLFGLDAATIGLALLGAAAIPPAGFMALFSVVLTAILVADTRKILLASGAIAVMYSAWAAAVGLAWEVVPLTLAAGLSFGKLAESLDDRQRPFRSAKATVSEQWALLNIAEAIGSSLDISQVMRRIVKQVGQLMETDSCSILLFDRAKGHCFVVASKGHPDVDMLAVDLADYPEVKRALETREPVVIDDVENEPLVADVREILLEKGYRSLLVVPLLFGREVIGALFVRGRAERPFAPDELRFCAVAAGASANALKNAMLYREIKEESARHRETGEKLRRVLDGSPDVIIACDEENRITEFNRGAEKLFRMSSKRALGRTLDDVLGAAAATFEGVASVPEPEPSDVVICRNGDEQAEISLSGAALCAANGAPAGRVWIGRDVTKLRRVEKSLAQAERLSSLGEIVAGVAHELNNPLAGVMGYAELLQSGQTDPSQLRDLERIVESAQRCQKIVVKLLSFARKHSPEKKHQSLNECLKKVLDLKSYHLKSSQIETILELDAELANTSFDFHQIEQVVLNLLNNAEQAIASTKSPGSIVLRSGGDAGFVWFEVEDNGPGIPMAVQDRVFDPFFTTKEYGQGTGLGLSVSFGIVQEHGGRIELMHSGEQGTCFRVILPLVAEEDQIKETSENLESVSTAPLKGRRVLVAEDEPALLEIYDRVLVAAGATVTLARDGEEAWSRMSEDDFDYDLIVTDLRMPNLNGQQLYERTAEERPDLLRRFVFTTGDLAREDTFEFLKGLPNRILSKPLQMDTVRRVLMQAMDNATK